MGLELLADRVPRTAGLGFDVTKLSIFILPEATNPASPL
jgi:hypothetical protein